IVTGDLHRGRQGQALPGLGRDEVRKDPIGPGALPLPGDRPDATFVALGMNMAEVLPIGPHGNQVHFLFVVKFKIGHRLPVGTGHRKRQLVFDAGFGGSSDLSQLITVLGQPEAKGSVSSLGAGVPAAVRLIVSCFCSGAVLWCRLAPSLYGVLGNDRVRCDSSHSEHGHKDQPVQAQPCLPLPPRPLTAVSPAASTAAIPVVSSPCSSALTVSRPLRALTSTPVTPGSCATASRTDASHPPQLIPVTTYSLVRIIVLLLISWCCHSSCTETLYPYRVYFNGWILSIPDILG